MKKIMIVGKECSRFIIKDILSNMFTAADAEIYIPEFPSDGIDLLKEVNFDLVVTGYVLGTIDGLNFCEIVKQMSPSTKILMASTLKPQNLDIYLEEKIIDAFYHKEHLDFDVLRNLINENLK